MALCSICKERDADPRDKRRICSSTECLEAYNKRHAMAAQNRLACKKRVVTPHEQVAPIMRSMNSVLSPERQAEKLAHRDEIARRKLAELQERIARQNHV